MEKVPSLQFLTVQKAIENFDKEEINLIQRGIVEILDKKDLLLTIEKAIETFDEGDLDALEECIKDQREKLYDKKRQDHWKKRLDINRPKFQKELDSFRLIDETFLVENKRYIVTCYAGNNHLELGDIGIGKHCFSLRVDKGGNLKIFGEWEPPQRLIDFGRCLANSSFMT
jgi:hypothetical protein